MARERRLCDRKRQNQKKRKNSEKGFEPILVLASTSAARAYYIYSSSSICDECLAFDSALRVPTESHVRNFISIIQLSPSRRLRLSRQFSNFHHLICVVVIQYMLWSSLLVVYTTHFSYGRCDRPAIARPPQ